MAKYKAYPAYKTTGLGWLTEIPDHWEVKKLKYLGQAIIGLTYSPDDVVDEGEGTLVLRSSNVQNGKLEFLDNVYVRKSIPLHLKVKEGDILICARNGSRALIGKNAKITKDAEGMTFGAFMSIFRSRYSNYLSHVFASALFEYQSGSFLTATINQLTTSNLNSFEIPLPPQTEQDRIVNFLDHETAKIDNLIEKQQQLIELLKEKRQAVISHAVTKGLNPDVPMKDSGVEWLGEVPAHWPMKKISWYFSAEKGKKGQLLTKEYCGSHPGIYPVYSGQTENNGTMGFIDSYEFNTEEDGVLFSTTVGAKAMSLNHLKGKFSLSQNCMIISPRNNNARIRFFFYHFQPLFQYERSLIPEHMQASFRMEDLYQYSIALPPKNEQLKIAKFLDHETAKIDNLIEKQQQQIELLQERRTALISAAVTGKIDVRDWVAPDTQDVEEPQEAIA